MENVLQFVYFKVEVSRLSPRGVQIANPEVLLDFVRYFHSLLHQELPHAVLVWYDSVTIQGNLNWQNGLNERNKSVYFKYVPLSAFASYDLPTFIFDCTFGFYSECFLLSFC